MTENAAPRYALISMPWFWAYLPSIQLAIVSDILQESSIESDTFEFYTDLIETTGTHLYKAIANDSGYVGELLFAQFLFDDFGQQYNENRPNLGFINKEIQDDLFVFGTPLIEEFLDNCFAESDWGSYDAVCFSLTASQTAASAALAKRIKAEHPEVPIIFGGSSCAGEMGQAILEMCPHVDVVVHGEAEVSLPQLVEALGGKREFAEVPGISWRRSEHIISNKKAPLHRLSDRRNNLNFESYFERVKDNEPLQKHGVWLPFESSRGCWYGEKAQCTFCGLNEIIQYRERGSDGLIEELEHYEAKYGVENFFAVDLIMPRNFFDEFLPAVEAKEKDWTIFYEIKSNMNRSEIEQLAASGVRWIQPGIESLDDNILKIMRKGVSAAHNIQTLRLSKELGIVASWNMITGFPREKARNYLDMVSFIPALHHLEAPVGLGNFEVHRFSPYFENPTKLGINLKGAYPTYHAVYPVEKQILDRLVYRYDYDLIDLPDPGLNNSLRALTDAIEAWRQANMRDADFTIELLDSDGALLRDSRSSDDIVETVLDTDQTALLGFLDAMRPEATVCDAFEKYNAGAFEALGRTAGVQEQIDKWVEQSIVLQLSGYVQSLAKRRLKPSRIQRTARKKSDVSAGGKYGQKDIHHHERVEVNA